jgi:hypothetical protein
MSLLTKDEVLALLAHPRKATDSPPLSGRLIGDCDFTNHVFSHPADFSGAIFTKEARFQHCQFQGHADFASTVFAKPALFDRARFEGRALFFKAMFQGPAHFSYCRFIEKAYFWRARFFAEANFLQMLVYPKENPEPDFTDPAEANFSWAWFMGDATFTRAQFHGSAYFWRTLFFSQADFDEVTFKARAWFCGTKTEVQIPRFEFSNPELLDGLRREGFLRDEKEEIAEYKGKRVPVFYLFGGVVSEKELVDKLQTLNTIKVSPNELEALKQLWTQGAKQMFAKPEQVSFRGVRFEHPEEVLVKDVNAEIPVSPPPRNNTREKVETPMRILFLAANPTTTTPLDLEEELRCLEFELRGAKYRDRITLTARHAVRPDDLIRYVRADKPNVIHFSGHGSEAGIILRDDTGGYKIVEGANLRRFLEGRGVDLVVLNACYSKGQADTIHGAVKTVVGTTDAVGDEAARRFTVAFYRSLGDGLSVREAFRDGGDAVALHGLIDVFHSDGDLDLTLVSETNG